MALLNPYLFAGLGMPYFGSLYGRPAAVYGGGDTREAPPVTTQGLIPTDFLNQDATGENALYPGLRPDYLASQQLAGGLTIPDPYPMNEQPPNIPGPMDMPNVAGEVPVVDKSFPAGSYEAPPSIADRVSGLFSGNYWPALMNAGLGMLAQSGWTRIPVSTGEAIGKGGLVGTDTYMQLRKQYANEGLAQEQIAAMRQQREATAQLMKEKVIQAQRMARLQAALAAAPTIEAKLAIAQQMFPEEFAKAAIADQAQRVVPKGSVVIQNGKPVYSNAQPDNVVTNIGAGGTDKQTVLLNKDTGEYKPVGKPWSQVPLVSMGQEPSFNQALGKGRGEAALAIESAGQQAYANRSALATFKQSYLEWKASGGTAGPLSGAQAFFSRALESGGLDPSSLGLPKSAGPAETMQAISNKLALSNIGSKTEGGMPANNFTEADRNFVVEMESRLGNSEEGLLTKAYMRDKVDERKQLIYESWINAEDAGMSFPKWRLTELPKIVSKPLFTTEEKNQMLRSFGKTTSDIESKYGLPPVK